MKETNKKEVMARIASRDHMLRTRLADLIDAFDEMVEKDLEEKTPEVKRLRKRIDNIQKLIDRNLDLISLVEGEEQYWTKNERLWEVYTRDYLQ